MRKTHFLFARSGCKIAANYHKRGFFMKTQNKALRALLVAAMTLAVCMVGGGALILQVRPQF